MAGTTGRMRLTARFVETVTTAERTDFHDDDMRGLMLRVSPSGAKSWAMTYYRPGTGERARITFGSYPAIGLADARDLALAAKAALARGEDPGARRQAEKRIETFDALADRYIEGHAKRHKRTWTRDAELLARNVRPRIGRMRLDMITKRNVLDILEEIEGRGAPVQAQRVFEVVRGLFRWALTNDYTTTDPTAGIKRRISREARSRFLSEGEVCAFWHGLDATGMDWRTRTALRLALVTGQRIGEVCEAERREIDLSAAVWTIPAQRSKNGREHSVPLSPLAIRLIRDTMDAAPNGRCLFPSAPRAKSQEPSLEQPLGAPAAARAMRRALGALGLGENPATPHDLRRTVASHMARLGLPESTIGRVLNHVSETGKTITSAVYIRHRFDTEKRHALELWAAELEKMVRG